METNEMVKTHKPVRITRQAGARTTQKAAKVAAILLVVVAMVAQMAAFAPSASATGSTEGQAAPADEATTQIVSAEDLEDLAGLETLDDIDPTVANIDKVQDTIADELGFDTSDLGDIDADDLPDSLPIPKAGVLKKAVFHDLPSGIVKTGFGRDLERLGAHLNPDTQYLYLEFRNGLDIETGLDRYSGPGATALPARVKVAKGVNGVIVLDPTDPYVYIGGACPKFGSQKAKKTTKNARRSNSAKASKKTASGQPCGVGFSLGGNIPFNYTMDNLPPAAKPVRGHVIVDAEVPVYKGMQLDGTAVLEIRRKTIRIAGEGDLETVVPKVGKVTLGTGAFGFSVSAKKGAEKVQYWTAADSSKDPMKLNVGKVKVDVPAGNERSVRQSYGAEKVSGKWKVLPSTYFELQGQFTYPTTQIVKMIGVNIGDMAVGEATLRIDGSGLEAHGVMNAGLHPDVQMQGNATAHIVVPFRKLSNTTVEVTGSMTIGGVDIGAEAMMRIDKKGLMVSGEINTPASRVAVSGSITKAGVQLAGEFSAELDLSAISNKATEAIDAAQAEIDKIDRDIAKMRETVKAERRAADKFFRDAQRAVENAQAEVDKINGNIRVNNDKIAALRVKLKNANIFEAVGISAAIESLKAANTIQRGLLTSANATLDLANDALQLIRDGLDALPTDADPRIIALFGLREGATAALQLAREAAQAIDIGGTVHVDISFSLGASGLFGDASMRYCDSKCTTLTGGSLVISDYFEVCVEVFGFDVCGKF